MFATRTSKELSIRCGRLRASAEWKTEAEALPMTFNRGWIGSAKKLPTPKRPRVMIAIDRIQGSGGLVDVYIAGTDGYFDKMIELAGGENVYHQGMARFPVVSTEGVMRMNPDVIVDLVSGVDIGTFSAGAHPGRLAGSGQRRGGQATSSLCI